MNLSWRMQALDKWFNGYCDMVGGDKELISLSFVPLSLVSIMGIDLRVGLNKGFAVTTIDRKPRPSHRKGRSSEKHKFVRSVVREVAGFAPYERRVLELLRNGKVCAVKSIENRRSYTCV